MNKEIRNWIVKYLLEVQKIDIIEGGVLDELLRDSRQSVTDLARKVESSRTTVTNKIDNLIKRGIIDKFTLALNYNKSGLPVSAFILVGYDTTKEDEGHSQKIVARKLSELKFVRRVNIITGSYDFIVEIMIDHMNSLADVIIEQIRDIPGVANTVTMVSFKEFERGKEINRPG